MIYRLTHNLPSARMQLSMTSRLPPNLNPPPTNLTVNNRPIPPTRAASVVRAFFGRQVHRHSSGFEFNFEEWHRESPPRPPEPRPVVRRGIKLLPARGSPKPPLLTPQQVQLLTAVGGLALCLGVLAMRGYVFFYLLKKKPLLLAILLAANIVEVICKKVMEQGLEEICRGKSKKVMLPKALQVILDVCMIE